MNKKLQLFFLIMLFYFFLSFVLGPLVFYFLIERSLQSAGNGFISGSLVSIILWLLIGSKMV